MIAPILRRLCAAPLAAGLLLAAATIPARAQTPYDPPTLQLVSATPSYVALRVTAGASGAPNGFYIEWMYKSVFDALGGWPSDPYDPSLYYCIFDGMPAWHVGGDNGYRLGPGESIDIVLGELFDETGVTTDYSSELSENQGVVVHGYTEGDATHADSPFTTDALGATSTGNNCTFTLGYWKNHSSAWPSFSTLLLGTVAYNKAQLLTILGKPSGGNGLLILAHQLITAKLNILHGADGTPVSATLAHADGLIGSLVVPPVGGGFLNPLVTNNDTNILDNYNNGLSGPGHCGDNTPTHRSTWGAIKTLYR